MTPTDTIPTGPSGLTTKEATARLEAHGPNLLPLAPGPGVWRPLLAQFFHFFAILLWVAGGLAFIAGLPELGVAIFGVIILNGLFAFIQEHRAEKAGERLREIVPRRATVVRDGHHREIEAADLVPGDLVVLAGGDRVSADMTAVESHSVRVDESILTGESVAVDKGEGDRLYSGTFIVEGEGLAVVEATAGATRLASLAALTTRVRRHVTPLAREIRRLVRTTTFIAVGVGLVFVIASTALGFDIESGLVFGIGVIVALVPEALLPTVTLSLAIGAQRMATHHALIRRLEAVETLGSTTFLCTDKTGTLTQNRMAVVEVWTPRGSATVSGIGYEPEGEVSVPSDEVEALVTDVAIAARRCSTGRAVLEGSAWTAVGDPMEAALDVLARRVGVAIDDVVAADPELARFPFDARRRRMSVVTKDGVFVKGAPDAVFPVCVNATQDAFRAVEALSTRGLRVLAVAVRHVRPGDVSEAISVERDLELAGLIGLEDPRDHPPPALSRRAARPG